MGSNISVSKETIENTLKNSIETLLLNIINVNANISNIVVVDAKQDCKVDLNGCIVKDTRLCIQTIQSITNVNEKIDTTTISNISNMTEETFKTMIDEQMKKLKDTLERITRLSNYDSDILRLVNNTSVYLKQNIKSEIDKKFKVESVTEQLLKQNISINCNKSQVYDTDFVQKMLVDVRLSGAISDISNTALKNTTIVESVTSLSKKTVEDTLLTRYIWVVLLILIVALVAFILLFFVLQERPLQH